MPDSCKAIVRLVLYLEYIVRAFSKCQLVDILLRKFPLNLDPVSRVSFFSYLQVPVSVLEKCQWDASREGGFVMLTVPFTEAARSDLQEHWGFGKAFVSSFQIT